MILLINIHAVPIYHARIALEVEVDTLIDNIKIQNLIYIADLHLMLFTRLMYKSLNLFTNCNNGHSNYCTKNVVLFDDLCLAFHGNLLIPCAIIIIETFLLYVMLPFK